MPAGAPSKYDFNLCVEVCERVSNGERIKKVLESDDRFPTFPTWCRWKREHDELFNLYTRSIQDKAECVDDEIDDIVQQVREGLIDPSSARVIIDTLKWKAAKYYPKMFGDKSSVDITTKGESINKPLSKEEIEQAKKSIQDEY
jgi:hypothetical protein